MIRIPRSLRPIVEGITPTPTHLDFTFLQVYSTSFQSGNTYPKPSFPVEISRDLTPGTGVPFQEAVGIPVYGQPVFRFSDQFE